MGRQLELGKLGGYALLAFPFAVVFLFIPTELYYHNIYDWGGDAFLLKSAACAGLIIALVVGLVAICFKWFSGWAVEKVCFWFFIAGVYLLFADVFAPLQLARLDGSVGLSDEPLMYTAIEAGLLIGIVLFARQLKTPAQRKACSAVATVLILCFVGYFAYAVKVDLPRQALGVPAGGEAMESVRRPNVYHIVLDEMETDYFLELLKHPERTKALKGFSLFKHNVSNYPYTDVSAASYLTGTGFYSGSFSKWVGESDNSLLNLAAKSGYSVNVYAKPALIHAKAATTYTQQDEVLKRYSELKHPFIKEFVRLWFARVSPNFMTNAALEYGSALGEAASNVVESNATVQPKTIEEGIEPYAGVFMFDDALRTEKDRPDVSSYLYLHALLPHGPYVLDEQCRYDPQPGEIANLYLRQAACALNKLEEFLAELERLGRLDDSIVIVQSDHGAGWAGFLDGTKESGFYSSTGVESENPPFDASITPWSKQQLESRSMALLMIKPAHADHALVTVDTESQLLDVYPTIADLAGIDTSGIRLDGVSLVSCLSPDTCNIPSGRERFFNFFSTDEIIAGNYYKFKVSINGQGRPHFDSVENAKVKVSDVELGSVISFSQSGFSDTFIGHGWSGQEGDHRWTDGAKADLSLPMKLSGKARDLLLRVKAGGFPGRGGPQQVDVLVNGVKVANWTLSGVGWYEAPIAKRVVGDGVLGVVFKIKDPTAPCEISASQDCRKLGMAVLEVSVAEQGVAQ